MCIRDRSIGGFLVATSANLPGENPVESASEFRSSFPDIFFVDDCEGESSKQPSTIVDVRTSEFKILRRGAIATKEISVGRD